MLRRYDASTQYDPGFILELPRRRDPCDTPAVKRTLKHEANLSSAVNVSTAAAYRQAQSQKIIKRNFGSAVEPGMSSHDALLSLRGP